MKDLGLANFWRNEPPEVKRCKKLGHKPSDKDVGPPYRGIGHVVECIKCNYVYRYDSSD